MVKNVTIRKHRLSTPTCFWASLLVSRAVVNCLLLQIATYAMENGIAPLRVDEKSLSQEDVVSSPIFKSNYDEYFSNTKH